MKNSIVNQISLGICLLIIFMLTCMVVSIKNREVDLFAIITEKNKANQQVHDKMWKTIQQSAGIAEKEKEAFMNVISTYMSVRDDNVLDGKGAFMSMLQEAYPTTLPELNYDKVMNIMESGRAEFQRSMVELFDVCREYTRLVERIPSRWFVDARPEKADLCKTIVSTRTDTSFKTGIDDNIDINW